MTEPERAADETESAATNKEAATDAAATSDAADSGVDNDTAADASTETLEAAQGRADENWDRYLRAAAELENVRKRASRDVERARKYALENFGRDMLEVKDSLELGLAAAGTADAAALQEGSEATLKLLASTLERFGVTELDPVGEPFDPELHEAMTMQPSAEAEPNTILTVIQKGYTLNGRLLRAARVIVAAEPPADA